MESHRGHLGGALLGLTGACWIADVVGVGSRGFKWASFVSVLLLAAGLLCLIGAVWAFGAWRAVARWSPIAWRGFSSSRATRPLIEDESRLSAPQGGTGTQGIDKRIALNEYRRRGAELAAAPPDEAVARDWSDTVVKFLCQGGWPFADVERFQNAGTGTAADRLRPRVDVLGALIARLDSSALAREPTGELGEDRQISVKLDTPDPANTEGE